MELQVILTLDVLMKISNPFNEKHSLTQSCFPGYYTLFYVYQMERALWDVCDEVYIQDNKSVKKSLKTESTDLNNKESFIKYSNNLSIHFITHRHIYFTKTKE